jgi:hypothetical protein
MQPLSYIRVELGERSLDNKLAAQMETVPLVAENESRGLILVIIPAGGWHGRPSLSGSGKDLRHGRASRILSSGGPAAGPDKEYVCSPS